MENTKIKNYYDLNAWQEGHKLVLLVYKMLKDFPKEERYGLTDQLRRASVSITSNIAEGFSRRSNKEKIQFHAMAMGSLTELQSQLFVARDVQYCQVERFNQIFTQTIVVQRLVNGLSRSCILHDT